MPEQHAAAVGDAVDRSLAALGELHDEQLLASDLGQELGDLLEPHRKAVRALVQELVKRSTSGSRTRNAPGARARHRLEAHRRVWVPELRRSARQLTPPAHASPERRANADLVEERIALGLVVRRPDRRRAGDEHGDARLRERRFASARPSRSCDDCGRTASMRSRRQSCRRFSAKIGLARRHLPERVAEPSAHRPLLMSQPTSPSVALAVLAQRANERRRPGRAAGGDEDAERPHRAGI